MSRFEQLVISDGLFKSNMASYRADVLGYVRTQELLMRRNHVYLYNMLVVHGRRYPVDSSYEFVAYSMANSCMYGAITDIFQQQGINCPLTERDIQFYEKFAGNKRNYKWMIDEVEQRAPDFLGYMQIYAQKSLSIGQAFIEGTTDVLIPFCLKLGND